MILFCYFALRPTPRPTPDGCAACERDNNERGVIWNALYRESPEATASSCDQGLDSNLDRKRNGNVLLSDSTASELLVSSLFRIVIRALASWKNAESSESCTCGRWLALADF